MNMQYESPGEYTVLLMATDECENNSTVERKIIVEPAEEAAA